MRKFKYFLRGRLLPCTLLFLLILGGGIALAILLPRWLAPVAVLERVFSFFVAILIVTARDLPERKISKLVLLFLPWMGAILCLVLRPLPYPPSAQKNGQKCEHGVLFSRIAASCERLTGIPAAGASSVEYFPVGREMYRRLLEDLSDAKSHIFLEYYIVGRGTFWGDILSVLERKAAEGVDVRVLYDDFGCALTLPEDYADELSRFGIKAAVFRPVKVGRGFSRRDHRKLAIIDDVCYTGGINLADEYIGERIRFGHWKDTAIRIQGDISGFSELFLRTWYTLRPSDGVPVPPKTAGGAIPFEPLSDGAGERLFPHVFPLLAAHAKEKLYLFTPYLSLPESSMQALRAAALAGVDVRVMIPHIPDKKPIFFLTRAYARSLAKAGVSVREYTPGFLHAKSAVLDGKYSLVSSYNLDFRSFFVQHECGAFVEDGDLAAALERDFLTTWEQGAPLEKATPFVQFLGRVCMLFAPLT